MSNEAGVLVHEGTILPLGMFEIDVYSPHARMWYVVPPGPPNGTTNASRTVRSTSSSKGTGRKDPGGLPLVRHQWSWSDGIVIEGEDVERTFRSPGWDTVILTIWDASGLPNSTTDPFSIYRYRCEEEQHSNPITPRRARSVAGSEWYPLLDTFRISLEGQLLAPHLADFRGSGSVVLT